MSAPSIRRLKRKLAEELESTGESHPMDNMKRPRVDNMDVRVPVQRIVSFTSETVVKIIWELVKAKSYKNPNDSKALNWGDDFLWEMIIGNLNLSVKVSVEDFKMTVLHYYQIYKQDPRMSEFNLPEQFLGQNTVELFHQVFKVRRENVGEYLISSYYRSAPPLAIEVYKGPGSGSGVIQPVQESASAGVSHESSDMILPPRSDQSLYSKFLDGLQQIKGVLTEEEVSWAECEMSKYKGQLAVFCAKNPVHRVNFVKKAYSRQYES